MIKTIGRIAGLIAVLVCVALFVSSPVPFAGAEGLDGVSLKDVVPTYMQVLLPAVNVAPIPYDQNAPYAPHTDGFLPNQKGYLDDTLSVFVDEFRWFDTNIQVTWVQVADASQMRTASYGKFPSQKTARADQIAKREKAVLAINGDYVVYLNFGYAIRNGELLRNKLNTSEAREYDVLLVDDKGDFTIIQQATDEKIAAYNAEHTAVHAFNFGPALVVDGVKNEYYPVKSHAADKRTQRMAIGQMGERSYVIVTTEGPDDKTSTGLLLTELADVFVALGAKTAYNLDGGSSSWLVLNYQRINAMNGSKHRDIADIVYFVTASPN